MVFVAGVALCLLVDDLGLDDDVVFDVADVAFVVEAFGPTTGMLGLALLRRCMKSAGLMDPVVGFLTSSCSPPPFCCC